MAEVIKGSLGELARAVDELETNYDTLMVAYHELEKENYQLRMDNDTLANNLRDVTHGS